jgi:hypothetical protein
VALAAERLRYQTFAGTLERSDVYLSISHQSGRHGFKLGLGHAGNGSGSAPDGTTIGFVRKGDGTGATHATAGYDYSFSKRSAVYAYYSHLSNQRNGITDFAINSLGAQAGATLKGVVGLAPQLLKHSHVKRHIYRRNILNQICIAIRSCIINLELTHS